MENNFIVFDYGLYIYVNASPYDNIFLFYNVLIHRDSIQYKIEYDADLNYNARKTGCSSKMSFMKYGD